MSRMMDALGRSGKEEGFTQGPKDFLYAEGFDNNDHVGWILQFNEQDYVVTVYAKETGAFWLYINKKEAPIGEYDLEEIVIFDEDDFEGQYDYVVSLVKSFIKRTTEEE